MALSVAQMREADRRAIEVLGIPGPVLMERAGLAVFERIDSGPVTVVCGKGNNGGDGYVVARLALVAGYDVHVIALANDADISQDTLLFKNVYTRLGGHCTVCSEEGDVMNALSKVSSDGVIIDAILGTGTRGEVSGLARIAIDSWPKMRTISVDIPSGLNADTGVVCGAAIRANETVTFQFVKKGFESTVAIDYLGTVHVADIGIPEICGDDEAWNKREREI